MNILELVDNAIFDDHNALAQLLYEFYYHSSLRHQEVEVFFSLRFNGMGTQHLIVSERLSTVVTDIVQLLKL